MPIYINDQEYVTVREAQQIAQRSADTIRRWIKSGLVQAHKDKTNRWLIERKSLERVLAGE